MLRPRPKNQNRTTFVMATPESLEPVPIRRFSNSSSTLASRAWHRGWCRRATFLALLICLLWHFPDMRSATIWTSKIPKVIRPSNVTITVSKPVPSDLEKGPLADLSTRSGHPLLPTRLVVDRSVLERLEGNSGSDSSTSFHWPPIVTRIPEPASAGGLIPRLNICNQEYGDFYPCRFLVPLRIAEQESKARIHLSQMMQLARELGRILVLPNVGKSRMGLCFKMEFEAYYDLPGLKADLLGDRGRVITMEFFNKWLLQKRPDVPTAQLLWISPKPDEHLVSHGVSSFSNAGLVLHVDNLRRVQDLDLPGCFSTKLRDIQLSSFQPLFVSLKPQVRRESKTRLIGHDLLDILSREDISMAAQPLSSRGNSAQPRSPVDPDIILVDWDLRHPAFAPSQFTPDLQYSAHLMSLADKLTPQGPYLAVHWRMETIAPESLPECALSLVDTLFDLLHDQGLAGGIQTVWFASDYPSPIFPTEGQTGRAGGTMKSGTFRHVTRYHHQAIEALRQAFEDSGDLFGWKLTGLHEESRRVFPEGGDEVLQDTGVLGILDKVISIRAALFVSGDKGCGRRRYVPSVY